MYRIPKKLFTRQKLTRRERPSKETIYNSFSFFAKEMHMPPKQAKHLWPHLATENQKTFTTFAGTETLSSTIKRKNPKSRVGKYQPTGPLGSHGQILPISLGNLHGVLNEPKGKMKDKWKRNRYTTGLENSTFNRRRTSHPAEQRYIKDNVRIFHISVLNFLFSTELCRVSSCRTSILVAPST